MMGLFYDPAVGFDGGKAKYSRAGAGRSLYLKI